MQPTEPQLGAAATQSLVTPGDQVFEANLEVDQKVRQMEEAFDELADRLVEPAQTLRSVRRGWSQFKAVPWGSITLGLFASWVVYRLLRR